VQDVGRTSAELQPIFEMLSSFFGFQKENVRSPLRALPTRHSLLPRVLGVLWVLRVPWVLGVARAHTDVGVPAYEPRAILRKAEAIGK
jgi:hypothetical protein